MYRVLFSFLLITFLNFIVLVFSYFFGNNLFFGYLSFFSFIIFIFYVYKESPDFLIVAAYSVIAMVSTLFISNILENGIPLIEIGRVSYSINLPVKACIQLLSFIFGAYLLFGLLSRSNLKVVNLTRTLNKYLKWGCRGVIICILMVLYILALKYGTPTIHGLHRNDFWTYVAPSWGSALVYFLIQFNFILGLNYSQRKSKIDLMIFGVVLFSIILMGERFTGILYSFFFFIFPILINKTEINFKITFWKKASLLSIAFFIISFALFKNFSAIDSNTKASENIAMRAVLQSQMWWALDGKSNSLPKDLDLIYGKYFGFQETERNSGTYYLMDLVASKSLVDARYETKSKFTMSGFFNNVYFFGYFLGFVVNFIWGAIFGVLSYFVYLGVKSRNLIFSFVSFKFLYKVQAILLVGSIPDIFSISSFAFLIICLFFLRLA